MSWPPSCNGKVFLSYNVIQDGPNLHYNWREASQLLEATVNSPLEVHPPEYGQIFKILFGQNPNKKYYEVIIGNFLAACTCLDFVAMISNSLGQQGKWLPYKHMYYVLQHVMFCGHFESFIHFPT